MKSRFLKSIDPDHTWSAFSAYVGPQEQWHGVFTTTKPYPSRWDQLYESHKLFSYMH